MIDFKKDYCHELDLDFYDDYIPHIDMKQLDVESRFIKARVFDKSKEINAGDKDLSWKIIFKKPDSTTVFNDCEILEEDGESFVLIPVKANTLAVAGMIISELVLMHKTEVYSSKYFYINCLPSLHADKAQIESTDDYQGLLEGLIKVEQALKELEKLDSIEAIHHRINVRQNAKTISFDDWAEYTSNGTFEVFLSGVKQIEGVDFEIDKTAKTITALGAKTFMQNDEVLLCMFRRMVSIDNKTTLPASRVELTPAILGQTNVQNALVQMENNLGAVTNNYVKKAGDTMTGRLIANGGVTGNLTGNATTATRLQTPRAINGIDFDGTAPITIFDNTKATPAQAQQMATQAETNAKAYTNQKVADLVNSAPATLDTLKELADALGNNPNFATTVATQIGLKADKTELTAGLAGKANLVHTHTSNQVTGMTNYVKPTGAVTAITQADSLNTAIGKLERALESKQASGSYLPTTGGNMTGNITMTGGSVVVGNLQGNATTATRLAAAQNISINGVARSFNGTAPISWTLAEIGAAPATHNHNSSQVTTLTGYNKASATAANLAATDSLNIALAKLENKIDARPTGIGRLERLSNAVTVQANSNSVNIGINGFNSATDMLNVYLSGVRLTPATDYTFNNTTVTGVGTVTFRTGDVVSFEVLRIVI